jgi:hypothetical protein
MSKSNAWENGLLLLLFNNTNFANVGDATGLRGSSTAGALFVSLHTADPGEAGTQSTSEATYTSYTRVSVPRSGSNWTVTGNSVSPAALVEFPTCTGGTNTITHFGVGLASTGANTLLYKGSVSPTIAVSSGITPRLTTASTIVED